MRAITIVPGVTHSAQLSDVPEPPEGDGAMLVRALALGVCGTDREIVAGKHGAAVPGRERLILGHESLGVVERAPNDCGFVLGDHVVGIVRMPDPEPCRACAAGEWDMCLNGRYVEHGIKQRDGFGAERFRIDPAFAVKVDRDLGLLAVLLEPASVVAKAWDHIDRIGRRSQSWSAQRALVTGAGPIGLLAALLGQQRGLTVHVLARASDGPQVRLTRALGGTYHSGDVAAAMETVKPDIVIECTGAPAVVAAVMGRVGPSGIVCLAGLSGSKLMEVDIGGLNRSLVLDNQVVFGTVNANRRHYEAAADALARADRRWLDGLISRRVPLERWAEALERRDGDIKVVIDFTL